MVDYYAVLGVNPTAEDIVIRAAYKALAQRYHPDRYPGSKDEAHRRMIELTRAYEVLADPVRRPKYDRRRSMYTRAVAARFNTARRFASAALRPRDVRSGVAVRRQYRVALVALMSVVVVLSIFNLYQYSGRIKEWVGVGTPSTPSVQVSPVHAVVVDTGVPTARPSAPGKPPAALASAAARTPSAKEKRRSSTKNAANDRANKTAPGAVGSEPCQDVAAVLGLCSPDKSAKSR